MYNCVKCDKPKCIKEKIQCEYCRKLQRISYKARQSRGLCGLCGKKLEGGKICNTCRYKSRIKQRKFRKETILHYGNSCAHCGLSDIRVLDIDHVNNDGAKQRREMGTGTVLYFYLRRNNYPKEYQILCRNCNWIKYLETKAIF